MLEIISEREFSLFNSLKGEYELNSKGKAIPLQDWTGSEGSSRFRLPDFIQSAHESGNVFSLTHRPHLPARNIPGTHFC
jgi:hypothetical protein